MNVRAWADVIGTAGFFTLVIVLIIQGSRIWRSRRAAVPESHYRELAEHAVRVQEETERQLRETAERLTEINTRVATLERILKDVD
ncbi:hypothetical protein [Plantactinospora sp. GCM10030261]|uniref:hypothetical protein n=1 Tax=Plantactinospora sp. GCM10030261 TaxID=3273420 RepID=UPI00361EF962